MRRILHYFFGFIFLALFMGCAEPIVKTDSSTSMGANLKKYRQIAIVDFQILGGSDRASFLIHEALFKELRRRGYEVLGRIKTNRKLKEAGISTNFATFSQNVAKMGRVLEADAIIGGTIGSYPIDDDELFYNVTVSISMMDVARSLTVWFGSGSCRNGTLKGCAQRIAKSCLKDFPQALKRR
jgi:hypothetical protein